MERLSPRSCNCCPVLSVWKDLSPRYCNFLFYFDLFKKEQKKINLNMFSRTLNSKSPPYLSLTLLTVLTHYILFSLLSSLLFLRPSSFDSFVFPTSVLISQNNLIPTSLKFDWKFKKFALSLRFLILNYVCLLLVLHVCI